MKTVIIILTILLLLVTACLFFLKRDLKRIRKNMKSIRETNSKHLIHSEISCKELNSLINEINNLLIQTKEEAACFERKSKALKKMVTNISHDLRTPLTSALGYIDILLSSGAADSSGIMENPEELRIVRERLKRLEELIDSFFAFSRLTLLETPPLENVNIIALLEESIAGHYEDYSKAGREICLKNSTRKFILPSNKEMLLRVFDNLINNAFRHSPGSLSIETKNQNPFQIVFINELSCFDPDIEHIFDEFYTMDISRTKGGTGLGLAIAKEFVERLGGSIYAEKEENRLSIVLVFPDANAANG